MSTVKFVSIPPKSLSQSILSTASTFRLSDIEGWDGVDLTSASFGSVAFGAFLSADRTVLELFSFDPTTIASGSISFVDRGLDFTGANTVVAANKLDWPAGTTVQLGADTPQILTLLCDLGGTQTITGLKTFTLLPKSTAGNATDGTELVTYAQALALATGTANINRIVVAGNGGATITAGQLVYLDVADGEWKLCDADTAGSVDNIILGLAQGAGTDGNPITNGVLLFGLDSNQTGLTTNTAYYASNTAGSISSTPGTTEVSVGISRSTTSILFYPRYNQQLTEDQQDALAGTSGTPSASNKFVTNDDTTGTGSVVRASVTTAISSKLKFGGDGSDGALSITSGTTTIDLGSAAVVVKNYTSISITGTGKLAFSNPASNGTVIILKSQGAVTLTSSEAPMIDASSLGGAGGSSVSSGNGNDGTIGYGIVLPSNLGLKATTAAAGNGGAITTTVSYNSTKSLGTTLRYSNLFVGAGGGSGSVRVVSGSPTGASSGAGGRGGGCLIIECAGAWNFTTTGGISVAGGNGGNGVDSSTGGVAASGGGGGGSGGLFIGLYETLTANSGTVTISAGTGGNGGSSGDDKYGGGGGASPIAAGSNGNSGSSSAKTGGNGANGYSIVTSNTTFS